jgi:hypothetical protein
MRILRVHSARDLGAQFTENPHRMVGQDGAYSVCLGRRALWFFGDTLIGKRVPGESLWFPGGKQLGPGDMSGHGSIERLLTNSALILDERTGSDGLVSFHYVCDADGRMKQLVPREPGEHPDEFRVWCLHGYASGASLYLFYQVVRMLAEGPMPVNFEIVGTGLAVGDAHDWNFRRIPSGSSTIWWPADQPQFGSTVLRPYDQPTVYVYGVLKDSQGTQRCYLSRVQQGDMECREKYEYLASDAPDWSPDVRDAVCIMTSMPNELSVSWNRHLGCYLAVHSLDLTGRIVGHTAPAPWGPWSEPVDLWRVAPPKWDYPVPYFPLIYAGKEHPELAGDNGRVLYITYVEFEEYFPHLIEVTLE